MIKRKFTSKTRDAMVYINNMLIENGYKTPHIIVHDPISQKYKCWLTGLVYEGKKTKNGSIIFKYNNNVCYTPRKEGYINTDITAFFLNMNDSIVEKLEQKIKFTIQEVETSKKIIKESSLGFETFFEC